MTRIDAILNKRRLLEQEMISIDASVQLTLKNIQPFFFLRPDFLKPWIELSKAPLSEDAAGLELASSSSTPSSASGIEGTGGAGGGTEKRQNTDCLETGNTKYKSFASPCYCSL